MAVLPSRPTVTTVTPYRTLNTGSIGMEPVSLAIGIGSILSSLFGNVFGAKKQATASREATAAQERAAIRAAELEKEAFDEQLAYLKQIDARDYADWLNREARDRADWEASERRRAPYRALGDSAIRTLADYIAVPGMRPAQEVPVQEWRAPNAGRAPVSTTMPVSDPRRLIEGYQARSPYGPSSFRDFVPGLQQELGAQGYNVELLEHPSRLDKVRVTGPDGRTQVIDLVLGAGGDNPQWGYMVEGASGASAGSPQVGWRNTSDPTSLLAKYGRSRSFRDLARV